MYSTHRFTQGLFILGIVFCSTVSLPAVAAQARISITSPAGGEVYVVGQNQFVQLAPTTRAKTVAIEISRDGGVTFSMLGTINNTVNDITKRNVLQFVITGPAANNCVIRATGNGATMVSGAFAITTTLSAGGAPNGAAGGDLTGTYPNPTVSAGAITANKINSEQASANFVLTANGTGAASFQPVTGTGSGNSLSGPSGSPANAVVVDASGNVGVGTSTPASKLDVNGNLNVSGTISMSAATRYYAVSCFEIVSDINEPDLGNINTQKSSTYLFDQTPGQSISCHAPLHLPQGAVITGFQPTVYDNDVSHNITVTLSRNKLSDGTVNDIQALTNPTVSSSPQVLVGGTLSHAVDNQNYAYTIKAAWTVPSGTATDIRVYGYLVTYTIVQPLP